MNKNPTSEIGNRYFRLKVVEYSHTNEKSIVFWKCECDCGGTKIAAISNLRRGYVKSCGCYKREDAIKKCMLLATHNQSEQPGRRNPLYKTWTAMKTRCHVDSPKYKYWHGRGIVVCDVWRNDYTLFRDWALAHGYKPGLSIDRIDSNGNYTPENCQWVTRGQNTIKSHLGKGGWKRDKNRKKIFPLPDKGEVR